MDGHPYFLNTDEREVNLFSIKKGNTELTKIVCFKKDSFSKMPFAFCPVRPACTFRDPLDREAIEKARVYLENLYKTP